MTKKDLNEKGKTAIAEEIVSIPVDDNAVDALATAMKQAEEFKDMAQRIQAEFDNYRKRNVDSVKNARADGMEEILTSLLPVIDNFERGLQSVDEGVKSGIELILKQVMNLLEKFEVQEIKALKEEFNPNFHHAIAQCEDGENANKIVEVFQKGYIRKNKVLRPSMVKVAQ